MGQLVRDDDDEKRHSYEGSNLGARAKCTVVDDEKRHSCSSPADWRTTPLRNPHLVHVRGGALGVVSL